MSIVSLSVLVLIFVVGHQISNAVNSDGSDFIISLGFDQRYSSLKFGFAENVIPIAVKVMPLSNFEEHGKLYKEFLALKTLNEKQKYPVYLPKVLGYSVIIKTSGSATPGVEGITSNEAMAMELLGRDLEGLQNNAPFGMYTQLHLATKLITAVYCIHVAGYVIRVLKPSDIVLRPEDINEICITNFEFAKKEDETSTNFTEGDLHFRSLNAHNKEAVGKVQDLESLFYILIQFSVGTLPWTKYTHLPNDCTAIFKRTLLGKFGELPYSDAEQAYIANGFQIMSDIGLESPIDILKTASLEIDAFYKLLTHYSGLSVYAETLVGIMTREKNNIIQNITEQDYVALLPGFLAEMKEVPDEDKILDWAHIKNVPNKSRDLEFIDQPTFKFLYTKEFLNSLEQNKSNAEQSQEINESSGGGEVEGYSHKRKAEGDPAGDV